MVFVLKMIIHQNVSWSVNRSFAIVEEMSRNDVLIEYGGPYVNAKRRCRERFPKDMFKPYDVFFGADLVHKLVIDGIIVAVAAQAEYDCGEIVLAQS